MELTTIEIGRDLEGVIDEKSTKWLWVAKQPLTTGFKVVIPVLYGAVSTVVLATVTLKKASNGDVDKVNGTFFMAYTPDGENKRLRKLKFRESKPISCTYPFTAVDVRQYAPPIQSSDISKKRKNDEMNEGAGLLLFLKTSKGVDHNNTLNGNNGEVTNTDDYKKGKKLVQNSQGQKKKKIKKQRSNLLRSLGRAGAKAVIGAVATKVTGNAAIGALSGPAIYGGVARLLKYSSSDAKNVLHLSDAASRLLFAYMYPFDERVKGVKSIRSPAQPSYSVTGFIRGTGYIGLQGFGFVEISPTLANDTVCCSYTTAAYNYTVTSANSTDSAIATGGSSFPAYAVMSNLPYNYATLTSNTPGSIISGRINVASLTCAYVGTVLNSSGQYYAYADPDNDSVVGANHTSANPPLGYSAANLSTKDACEISSVGPKSMSRIVVLPSNNYEMDYSANNNTNLRKAYPFSQGQTQTDANTGASCAVIAITGKAGEPFYFEAIVHAEYIGSGVVQSLLTESQSDAVGYDALQTIEARAQRSVASNPNLNLTQAIKQEMRREGVVFCPGFLRK